MSCGPPTRSLLSSIGHEPADQRIPATGVPSMIEPKIDDLLAAVDSKYTIGGVSAKRAREINSYYSQLGEGGGEVVPPLVETGLRNKPLSIALEEIAERRISHERRAEIV